MTVLVCGNQDGAVQCRKSVGLILGRIDDEQEGAGAGF